MGLLGSIGKAFNDITGVSSSAKQQASLQSNLNREMAQNYHQWEMKDLEKAGLNPALTLGDISGGGSAGGASAGQPSFNPFDIINSAVSAYTAKKQGETGDTQGALNLATAGKVIAETKGIPQQIKNDTIRALASQTGANATMAQAKVAQELAPEQKKKINAETEESGSRTDKNKKGLPASIFGTEDGNGTMKTLGAFAAGLLPYGRVFNAARKFNSARRFGKYLNSIR